MQSVFKVTGSDNMEAFKRKKRLFKKETECSSQVKGTQIQSKEMRKE